MISPTSTGARARGALALSLMTFVFAISARAEDGSPLAAIGNGDTPPLSLEECVSHALSENSLLAQERLRRDEIRGQGWQTVSEALPKIDLMGTVSRSRDPSFLLDESFAGPPDSSMADSSLADSPFGDPEDLPAQTFWRGELNSTWEINPLRIVNALSALDARRNQQRENLTSVTHQTAESTMQAFFEVHLHRERLDAVKADIAAREEFLNLSRKRFQLELSTELDTLQAAVSLANLVPSRRRAEKDLRNAASRLNVLMGREPSSPLSLLDPPTVESDAVPLAQALALALERPDLRALELELRFLHKERGAERADHWPHLSLSGAYGYVAREFDSLVERDLDYWNANISLVIPLFDGFLTKGRVDESSAGIRIAERQLQEAERQTRLEVMTSLEELEAARENLHAARLNLKAADRALAQMRLRYELGKAQYLDVLNTQSDHFTAKSLLIEARFDVLSQTATLKRQLGIHPLETLSRLDQLERDRE